MGFLDEINDEEVADHGGQWSKRQSQRISGSDVDSRAILIVCD
jgi:hypothetical protein